MSIETGPYIFQYPWLLEILLPHFLILLYVQGDDRHLAVATYFLIVSQHVHTTIEVLFCVPFFMFHNFRDILPTFLLSNNLQKLPHIIIDMILIFFFQFPETFAKLRDNMESWTLYYPYYTDSDSN